MGIQSGDPSTNAEMADEIISVAGDIRDGQDRLNKIENKNRKLIIGIAISLIFDIILSIAAIGGVISATDASHKAAVAAHAATVASSAARVNCIITNSNNEAQLTFWHQVESGFLQGAVKPDQLQKFDQLINDTFIQHDCSKL